MRKLLSFILVFVAVCLLVGCTTDNPGPGPGPGPDEKNPISDVEGFDLGGKTVKIFTRRAADFDYAYSNPLDPTKVRNDDENEEYWTIVEDVTKAIETKYNCKIEWVDATSAVTGGSIWNHLKSVYASGEMYDIVSITGEEFPYMYSNGMVLELPDDYLSDDVVDLFWGGEEGFQYNYYKHLDKRWGVGGSNNIYDAKNTAGDNAPLPVLFYDIDLLKSAGITKMPSEYYEEGTWSWDVFEEMCKQVVERVPGSSGLVDHFYSGGIQTFIGSNGSFIFDTYGNMGFYSEAAQQVYTQWEEWYNAKLIRNFTYETTGAAPDVWYNQRWFRDEDVAFIAGRLSYASAYWNEINYSIVPYPFGPNAAQDSDPTKIDNEKFNINVYTTGYFWTVPKGGDLRHYQLLAEFYGGLKAYYPNADDTEATIDEIAIEFFDYSDETAADVLKYVQNNMNFYIIQSAVPSGIFRQSIREHYNKSSNWYGQMYTYLLSRRAELDPDNPNNFWKSTFGEPGIQAQS